MKNLFIYLLLITSFPAIAQQKSNSSKAIKMPVPVLQKLLMAGKFDYRAINDSLYQVDFTGDNIERFKVLISKISDLYVIAVDVTEDMNLELKPEKYKMLLSKNDEYDMVKIGISESNNHLYVRCDTYSNITSVVVLKKLINQVSAVTDIIAGELKK
ncbi:MAG: hypothetical protein ABIN67_04325 [Ferruginibacter sp.]